MLTQHCQMPLQWSQTLSYQKRCASVIDRYHNTTQRNNKLMLTVSLSWSLCLRCQFSLSICCTTTNQNNILNTPMRSKHQHSHFVQNFIHSTVPSSQNTQFYQEVIWWLIDTGRECKSTHHQPITPTPHSSNKLPHSISQVYVQTYHFLLYSHSRSTKLFI